jgi:hypothetical protein
MLTDSFHDGFVFFLGHFSRVVTILDCLCQSMFSFRLTYYFSICTLTILLCLLQRFAMMAHILSFKKDILDLQGCQLYRAKADCGEPSWRQKYEDPESFPRCFVRMNDATGGEL